MEYKFLAANSGRLECTDKIIDWIKLEGEQDNGGGNVMKVAIATRDANKTPRLNPYLVITAVGLGEYMNLVQFLLELGLHDYDNGFGCDNVFSVRKN